MRPRRAPAPVREKGCDQILAVAEEIITERNDGHRQCNIARSRQGQQSSPQHTPQCSQREQAFFRAMQIGIGAEKGRRQQDGEIGHGQRRAPHEAGPSRLARHHRHKIRAVHRGNDDGGIAGVGEVVHRPRPYLALADTGIEGTGTVNRQKGSLQRRAGSACRRGETHPTHAPN